METREINGITYERIEQSQKKVSVSSMMLMAEMMTLSMSSYGGRGYKGSPPSVDIIDEFELIQAKKSNLSRSEREWVVNKFNSLFKQVAESESTTNDK